MRVNMMYLLCRIDGGLVLRQVRGMLVSCRTIKVIHLLVVIHVIFALVIICSQYGYRQSSTQTASSVRHRDVGSRLVVNDQEENPGVVWKEDLLSHEDQDDSPGGFRKEELFTKHKYRFKYKDLVEGSQWQLDNHKRFVKGLNQTGFIQPTMKNAYEAVVVIAATRDTYAENAITVASVQKFLPKKSVVVYDWGLSPEQARKVSTWCNVQLKRINFSEFAEQYSLGEGQVPNYNIAKIFSISFALKAYCTVLWLDTSVRLASSSLRDIYKCVVENEGLVFIRPPAFFVNFSLSGQAASRDSWRPNMADVSALVIIRTEYAYENALWWWYLCSMVEKCIFPTFSTMCEHKETSGDFYGAEKMSAVFESCHNVDKSLLNILGGNMYKFYVKRYGYKYRMVSKVIKIGFGQRFELLTCDRVL